MPTWYAYDPLRKKIRSPGRAWRPAHRPAVALLRVGLVRQAETEPAEHVLGEAGAVERTRPGPAVPVRAPAQAPATAMMRAPVAPDVTRTGPAPPTRTVALRATFRAGRESVRDTGARSTPARDFRAAV